MISLYSLYIYLCIMSFYDIHLLFIQFYYNPLFVFIYISTSSLFRIWFLLLIRVFLFFSFELVDLFLSSQKGKECNVPNSSSAGRAIITRK